MNGELSSAYGGKGWSPRTASHREEIGLIWGSCGVNSEWGQLLSVLLHQPGNELKSFKDPAAVQMIEPLNLSIARDQHLAIAKAFRNLGISVHYVEPETTPPPNLMFCADLFFMTPEGAILARPASTVRAGEERLVARRLSSLGIPILCTLTGNATFEGADAFWIGPKTVLLGRGLRTNTDGINQVSRKLKEIGVDSICVDLPFGTMHLMGIIRLLSEDLAVAWPGRVAFTAVKTLQERGISVLFAPDEEEVKSGHALNFVTIGQREILMPAGNPKSQTFYRSKGITVHTVDVSQLSKAAGAIGCLTGILQRDIMNESPDR